MKVRRILVAWEIGGWDSFLRVVIVLRHHAYYTVNPKIIVDRIINKTNNNLFKIINYTRCY